VTWKDFLRESVVDPSKALAAKAVNARVVYDQVRDIYDHELREVESGRERSDLKG
jgi:hypothetical protein